MISDPRPWWTPGAASPARSLRPLAALGTQSHLLDDRHCHFMQRPWHEDDASLAVVRCGRVFGNVRIACRVRPESHAQTPASAGRHRGDGSTLPLTTRWWATWDGDHVAEAGALPLADDGQPVHAHVHAWPSPVVRGGETEERARMVEAFHDRLAGVVDHHVHHGQEHSYRAAVGTISRSIDVCTSVGAGGTNCTYIHVPISFSLSPDGYRPGIRRCRS